MCLCPTLRSLGIGGIEPERLRVKIAQDVLDGLFGIAAVHRVRKVGAHDGIGGKEERDVPAQQMSVAPYLGEGEGTVGTKLEISHDAATPLGMKVWAESELIEIDRRRLVFEVKAFDECGQIGAGRHERFIINNEKFIAKANAKGAK